MVFNTRNTFRNINALQIFATEESSALNGGYTFRYSNKGFTAKIAI